MTDKFLDNNKPVDDWLEEVSNLKTQLPPGLTERVLLDAAQVQGSLSPKVVPLRTKERSLAGAIGWRAMTGLAAACCAGFWIGVSAPAGVDAADWLVFPVEQEIEESAVVSAFGWDLSEG